MLKSIRRIFGILLISISGLTLLYFGRIVGLFLFLSQDGNIVPHSILQLKLCLLSLGPVGLYFVFTETFHRFLNQFNDYIIRLSQEDFIKLILGTALILRILVLIIMPLHLWIDYQTYDELAWDWTTTGGYNIDGLPTAYRPPGYPFFLSRLYSVFGHHPHLGVIANVIMSTIIIFLSFRIIKRVWNEEIARWAAIILVFFPSQILFVNLLASEILFTMMFLISILLFLSARKNSKYKPHYILIGGIVLGLATLTRPITLIYLIIPAGLWYFESRAIKQTLINVIIAGLGLLAVVTPWVMRNYNHEKGAVISTNAGINLMIGNQPGSGMGWNQPVTDEFTFGDPSQERYIDSVGRARAIQYIKNDPVGFIKRGFLKLLYFYAVDMEGVGYQLVKAANRGTTNRYVILGAIAESYYVMILLFGCLGLITIYFKKIPGPSPGGFLLWSTIFYWSMVHFVFFADGRFHFPIMPIIVAFAAVFIISKVKT